MKFWQLLVDAHCPPRKVLIIDDDDALRETLKEQFTLHDEFEISDAATASAGLKQLRSEMVDLVLLDVRLPDMDGREACKQMRKSGYRGPIVMLTAQDTEADTILGLDSGANDYIAKPFRFGVLLARIRAQLRQLMEPDDTPPDDDDDDDLPPPDRAGLRMTKRWVDTLLVDLSLPARACEADWQEEMPAEIVEADEPAVFPRPPTPSATTSSRTRRPLGPGVFTGPLP